MTDFTAARGRRFALTLAPAFGVLALIAFWRERSVLSMVLAAIASITLVAGLVIPGRLEPVEKGWMALAHAISRVTTPIFMGIVYFVILTPVGVVRRLAGANSLVHRPDNGSHWIRRPARDAEKTRRQMERQF